MEKENVYGVQVNQAGGMSKLAKSVMMIHIVFIGVYILTAIVTIVSTLMQPDSMANPAGTGGPGGGGGGGRGGGGGGRGNQMLQSMISAALMLIVPPLLFFLVRKAISENDRNIMTCLMACDGCASFCNCCGGFCAILGVVGMFALKALYESEEDICMCPGGRSNLVETTDRCHVNFDYNQCREGVDQFTDGFGGAIAFLVVQVFLMCGEMACCIFAAMQLSNARNKLPSYSFCGLAPQQVAQPGQPAVVVGNPIMGQPVMGTVVANPNQS